MQNDDSRTGFGLQASGRIALAQSRTALALASPASGELTLETAPVVRSDCELTRRAPGHKEWPASALLASFGAVSDCRISRHSQSAGAAKASAVRECLSYS